MLMHLETIFVEKFHMKSKTKIKENEKRKTKNDFSTINILYVKVGNFHVGAAEELFQK